LEAGRAISTYEIHEVSSKEFSYPCYGANGLRGYVANWNQDVNAPLIGRQGALCGNVCYVNGKFYATEHAIVAIPQLDCDSRFFYYLLSAADLNQYKTAGAQPGLSVTRLNKVKVVIPPLAEQCRIVAILDHFDALCHNLTDGLPAEIAARQRQYDYYRDKLLTFPRKKA
jgi:type I restriction enzyme S subunit